MTEEEAQAWRVASMVSFWAHAGVVLAVLVVLGLLFRRRIVAAVDRFWDRVNG